MGDPKRSSMGSDVKEPIEDDTDSMEEYEGGDAGMNSFHVLIMANWFCE